jgi:DNA-binding transcriptional LysR family regulator
MHVKVNQCTPVLALFIRFHFVLGIILGIELALLKREMLDDTFRNLGIKPNIAFEAEECNAVMTFVSMSFGISIIPKVPALDNSGISALKIVHPPCSRTIYMAWMENRYMTPPVKKVKDFVTNKYGSVFNKATAT